MHFRFILVGIERWKIRTRHVSQGFSSKAHPHSFQRSGFSVSWLWCFWKTKNLRHTSWMLCPTWKRWKHNPKNKIVDLFPAANCTPDWGHFNLHFSYFPVFLFVQRIPCQWMRIVVKIEASSRFRAKKLQTYLPAFVCSERRRYVNRWSFKVVSILFMCFLIQGSKAK